MKESSNQTAAPQNKDQKSPPTLAEVSQRLTDLIASTIDHDRQQPHGGLKMQPQQELQFWKQKYEILKQKLVRLKD